MQKKLLFKKDNKQKTYYFTLKTYREFSKRQNKL